MLADVLSIRDSTVTLTIKSKPKAERGSKKIMFK